MRRWTTTIWGWFYHTLFYTTFRCRQKARESRHLRPLSPRLGHGVYISHGDKRGRVTLSPTHHTNSHGRTRHHPRDGVSFFFADCLCGCVIAWRNVFRPRALPPPDFPTQRVERAGRVEHGKRDACVTNLVAVHFHDGGRNWDTQTFFDLILLLLGFPFNINIFFFQRALGQVILLFYFLSGVGAVGFKRSGLFSIRETTPLHLHNKGLYNYASPSSRLHTHHRLLSHIPLTPSSLSRLVYCWEGGKGI